MIEHFVDDLAEFLKDYVGMVMEIEAARTEQGQRGIHSLKELRVMHLVFGYWRDGSSCTVTQIARDTGISKTTVSRAVTSLMTNGLLREQMDPEDGRKRLLLPTESGTETLEVTEAWLWSWAERLGKTLAIGESESSIVVGEKGA